MVSGGDVGVDRLVGSVDGRRAVLPCRARSGASGPGVIPPRSLPGNGPPSQALSGAGLRVRSQACSSARRRASTLVQRQRRARSSSLAAVSEDNVTSTRASAPDLSLSLYRACRWALERGMVGPSVVAGFDCTDCYPVTEIARERFARAGVFPFTVRSIPTASFPDGRPAWDIQTGREHFNPGSS